MDKSPYRVYFLGGYVRSFPTRDEALDYINRSPNSEDYEILDRSDFL